MNGGLLLKMDGIEKQIKFLLANNEDMLKGISDLSYNLKLEGNLNEKKLNENLSAMKSEMKSSWTDIVKGEVKKCAEKLDEGLTSLKKEVISTKDKVVLNYEIEEKASNIIIFKLQESKEVGYENVRKEELENIMHVLKTVTNEKIDSTDINNYFRLGKKDGSNRPLLVKFKTKTNKNLIMDNLTNFNKLEGIFKGIGIGHDLTKEQREECKKLADIGKEKENLEKGEFIYRVRGSPGNFRLVKIRKRTI